MRKKLILLILVLLVSLFITSCYGDLADIESDPIWSASDAFVITAGDIANWNSYNNSVDIVQFYESGVSENDTISLAFAFEPSKIVIDYSAICHHENYPDRVGHTTGHVVITITGADTITHVTNYTAICDYDGTMDSAILHNTVDMLMAAGGYDGSTFARCWGTGAWTTATHTLLITFDDVQNANDPSTFFEMVAVAYR